MAAIIDHDMWSLSSPPCTNRLLRGCVVPDENSKMRDREKKNPWAVLQGERLASVRKEAGLTQRALSKLTGEKLGETRIANYEQGIREIGAYEAEVLGGALNVNSCYLIGLIDKADAELLSLVRKTRLRQVVVAWQDANGEGRSWIEHAARFVNAGSGGEPDGDKLSNTGRDTNNPGVQETGQKHAKDLGVVRLTSSRRPPGRRR